jgi:hypothetical protein
VPPAGAEIGAGDRRRVEVGRRLVERIDAVRTANGEKVGKSFSIEVAFADQAELVAGCVQSLLLSASADVQELFLAAVWLCAKASAVRAAEGETLVLLDVDGERLAGSKVDLADEKAVVEAVRSMLSGPGRLAARAKRATTADVASALDDLVHAEEDRREAARRALVARFPAVAPAVVHARWTSESAERSAALAAVVGAAFVAAAGKEKVALLPFGATVAPVAYDPCPPCGMAMVPDASRKLLRFLAR